jgi:hypothetical protein
MKVILGTSNVPTTIVIFIILFVTLGILLLTLPLPQFLYAQTVENEIIENTLRTVEKAIPNSLEITEPFQLENITNNLSNNTENALAGAGQTTEETTDSNITSRTSDQYDLGEYKLYESPIMGVKFKIPLTWDFHAGSNNTIDCFEEVDKTFGSLYNDCTVVLINVNDKVWYLNDFKIYISKHSASNYSLVDFLTLVNETNKQQEDYSFINDKEITIQNNPAWQIEYSTGDYKIMNIVTKINNTFYSLLYLPTNSSVYSKYLPEFKNFVNSLEFIPSKKPIEPVPSFLKYSTLKTTTTNNITDLLFEKYYPIVKVDYESDSMIVLEGNKNYLSEINGSLVPFWEAIDVVKNKGYSLNEITTSGTGTKDNPIIFYSIFFNNSRIGK